jgi:hypothetical protein
MNTYRSAGILIATILAIIASSPAGTAETYDLVILNGRVMDPESGLDAVRNVGVKGGKIVEITETKIDGKETIDATGHVVAPGFIDLHIHGQDPYAIKLLLRDGVTSALEIEFGAYPVEDYYNKREGKWQANFGVSVGHAWARMNVMDGVNPKGLGFYSGSMKAAARKGSTWSKKRSDSKGGPRYRYACWLLHGSRQRGDRRDCGAGKALQQLHCDPRSLPLPDPPEWLSRG